LASQGSYDPVTDIWTVGTLTDDGTATLDIVVTVDQAGAIVNVAEVTATDAPDPDSTPGNGDPGEDDRDSTVLTSDPIIDLTLDKDVSAPTAEVGSQVTYVLEVANDGPSDATGVVVNDDLPAGVSYVSHLASQGTYDPDTGIWAIGTVDTSIAQQLTITVVVDQPGLIRNLAEVTDQDQTDVDSEPAENELSPTSLPDQDDEGGAVLTGIQIDLELEKTVDVTDANVGDQVTYTLTLVNQGPSSATGVAVEEQLPAGLSFDSATASAGAYDPGTGLWTVGNLGVDAPVTLQIVATITAAGPVLNAAQVDAADQPDVDSTPSNDDGTEDDHDTVSINGLQVDLSLTKTVDDQTPDLGTTVSYTLELANAGPSDATGVVVMDELPVGVEWVTDTSGGAYDPSTGLWTVGSLASGDTVAIDIEVMTISPGAITNVAEVVEVDQPDVDSSPGNGDPDEDDRDGAVLTPQTGSVHGTLWLDRDGDGIFDDDELPIEGVTVLLLDTDGNLVASAVTDADGNYAFIDIAPGTYMVRVDRSSLPDTVGGQTYDPDSVSDSQHEITVVAGENVVDIDFGFQPAVPPVGLPAAPVDDGSDGGGLARTGLDAWSAGRFGLVLVLTGFGVLLVARRARTS
jgi:uncharacterized repeat protein (TIGR01451 family)